MLEAPGWRAFLYLSLVGLGLSSYLTAVSIVTADLSYCSPNPFFSCEAVIYSSYSRILGVPVALPSALGFAILFALSYIALWSEPNRGRSLLYGVSGVALMGLAFGVYLTYIELIVIGALCILCFATFLVIIPLALLSLRGLSARPRSV